MTEDFVTVYRATEPQPEPGWRLVEESVETASSSYEVPRGVWEAYRSAERDFQAAAHAVGQYVTGSGTP
jgi:hypothetical protein